MQKDPIILAIESSCDDTAAAVSRGNVVLSSVTSSQLEHARFGGVVPEIASRAHQRVIVTVVESALEEAGVEKTQLEAIAVTYGPGLAGSLLVGLSFAKALSLGLGIPLIGVNHIEGHLYSVFIEGEPPPFPYLCLTVSGGHSQLVLIEDNFQHTVLGTTRDDAAGEAFDKVAKLLNLGYPGGPVIDKLAQEGDPNFHTFPRSEAGRMDFSFSGIKTAVLYYLNSFDEAERAEMLRDHLNDICASFQQAVVDMLLQGVRRAVKKTGAQHLAIVGGVSANSALRSQAAAFCAKAGLSLHIPPMAHCMDNAAMIAVTGYFKLKAGETSPLTLTAEPSLRLTPAS